MQTTTEAKIEAVKNQVGEVLYKHRAVYCNGTAMRVLLAEKEKQILIDCGEHPAPEPLHIPNSSSHPFLMMHGISFVEYTTNKVILDLFESTPAWQEAHGILQPLVDELATLEAQLANEVAEKGQKQNALNAAVETALEAARLAALESPEVVKARRDLEALDAPRAKAEG